MIFYEDHYFNLIFAYELIIIYNQRQNYLSAIKK